VSLVEESAKNQIKYLQTRIKEIVEETHNSSLSSTLNGSPPHQSLQRTGKNLPLLNSVRQELDSMCKELIAVREALRAEGDRRDSQVNQKMGRFEEFRLAVLD